MLILKWQYERIDVEYLLSISSEMLMSQDINIVFFIITQKRFLMVFFNRMTLAIAAKVYIIHLHIHCNVVAPKKDLGERSLCLCICLKSVNC